ncbi:MAG: deacylase [Ignavibacteriales bacterium CG07_land_8_20_14_0_80_59_12]|nr:MAG: deacylase [Ignavibacteriales bacterium CG07_land_8_20_14_0_80_59_12]
MSDRERFLKYLDEQHVSYTLVRHVRAFTSQEVAGTTHVPGRELAKTVVVKADDRYAMAVLPAPRRVNLKLFREVCGAKEAHLATEEEMEKIMPSCEVGAMPPFGHFYNLPVYVDRALTTDVDIVFNACTHTDAVKMSYSDYAKLVQPNVADFTDSAS